MFKGSKKDYRKLFKARRLSLTDAVYRTLNEALLANFEQISLAGIHYIHSFLPIPHQKEPDTFLFIDYLRKAWPDIHIVVPKSDLVSGEMTHHVYREDQELLSNAWGIIEPAVDTHQVDIALMDMVLIPLLAFDKKGHRIGYGKGFYDRFLSQCRGGVQKIGLSLFEPVDEITDTDIHDVPLDCCITPKQIWTFSR